jgi:hypothetical protein
MPHKFVPWTILITVRPGFLGREFEAVHIDICPTLVNEFHAIVTHEQSSMSSLPKDPKPL